MFFKKQLDTTNTRGVLDAINTAIERRVAKDHRQRRWDNESFDWFVTHIYNGLQVKFVGARNAVRQEELKPVIEACLTAYLTAESLGENTHAL